MENSFDIIRVESDDSLAWLEAARELSAARLRVRELLADAPGEYIVFNQESKTLVAHFSSYSGPQVPEWWRHEEECEPEAQPATAAAPVDDFSLEDEADDFFRVLQPAVA